jgi:thioredoxin 1
MIKVLKFGTTDCAPCKQLKPMLDSILSDPLFLDRIELVDIDIDEEYELASQFGIKSAPTLVVTRNGEELGRKIGSSPKPALMSWLRGYIPAA